jgi:light-regulated signal transduction histidine kinase (bacteriophytochrome)
MRQHAEENLKATVAKLEHTNAELQRSNTDLERFAYIASHDLQEPLRMVSSYTQLLEKRYKDRLDADANEFIDYAVNGAKRMQQLITDLLAYSRISTRGKSFETTDIGKSLDTAIDNLAMSIRETGAVITRDPLPSVMADGSQLVQVFQNLLDNAIKFHGEEPPRIHVAAEKKRGEWVFSVRDNGIGIDPQYFERVFIVFQRLHSQEYRGTGIGLSIVQKIVHRHGGRIWIKSEPAKGSTFYFSIPTESSEEEAQDD